MKTLIDSLKTRITSETGVGCYFASVDVKEPTYPYVLLWSSAGSLEVLTMDGGRVLDDRLGVTMVDTTANNVLLLAGKVRAALKGFAPASGTWVVDRLSEPFDSRPVEYDRDVNVPGHGYPHYAVDLYDLHGYPKPAPAPEVGP